MLQNLKKNILYFIKNAQFTLKTWKNAQEIAQAYARSPGRKRIPIGRFFGKTIITFIVAAIVALIWSIFGIVRHYTEELPEKSVDLEKPVPRVAVETEKSPEKMKDEVSSTGAVLRSDTQPVVAAKPEILTYPMHSFTDSTGYFILVANKAVKEIYVLQNQSGIWRVVRKYDIAIGEQEGQKMIAGDRRTPEGHYCIIGRKERSELSTIYGPLAYVLDYPNEDDRRAGRTGQGIWIHGTDPDSLPLETRGCIEMRNEDLTDLSTFLKSGIGTPVVILFNPELIHPASVPDFTRCEMRHREIVGKYRTITSQFNTLVNNWKDAWEAKDISDYQTFYDTLRFSAQGMGWSEWKERKLRTFELYDTISISVNNIRLTDFAESVVIVKFMQEYETNLNKVRNGKKLFFEKNDDLWKITRETTCPEQELFL